jgi:hypothetical protein
MSAAPRDLMDRVLKQSLKNPANLRAFLNEVVPDLAPGFIYDDPKYLDPEFQRDDWRRREADLAVTLRYRAGAEERTALVCVLIEHQSDTDPLIPLRTLYFATGYWDREWSDWHKLPTPRPPLRLSPVLPVVLHTGSRPWGSNRTLVDLLGEPASFHRFAPVWEPVFWNLMGRTPEALLDSGDGWLQMLAVMRVEHAEAKAFRAVFTEALRRLEAVQERDDPRWEEPIRIILAWGQHRRPREERPELTAVAETSQTNALRRERVKAMGQTIAESLREEGQLLNARTTLRLLLEDRFGTLPATVLEQISANTDIQSLQKATRQMLRITKLEELQL